MPSFVVLPARASQDWSLSAPWLRACCWPADSTTPRRFLFQRDYILGTSFDLIVWTTQAQEARQVEDIVLAEIDRLCLILSRYDSQSEISRLNAGFLLSGASPDLIAVLRAYEMWTPRTGGALSGQVGGLLKLWKTAEATGITPSGADFAACLKNLRVPGWRIDSPTGQVRRLDHQSLNVDCLGKGYILQKAVEAARTGFPGVWGIMLNIGGDMCVWGNGAAQAGAPWRIFCADPHRPYDNAPPLTSIELFHGAVATSAAYERGFTVAGKRYSHILDPRNGWPAQAVASATAVARDSLTANALATTLCVLTPAEGLSLLRMIEGAEGLIVAADGTQFRTPGFGALETPVAQVPPVSDAPASASSSTTALSGAAIQATVSAAPVSPGQTVTIITGDQVSFVKGAARVKRPVQPDEKFRVMSVNGDDVTIADQFGYEATLNRNSLKTMDVTPAPVATTSAATNAAPASPANIAGPSTNATPLSPGQVATIVTDDQVNFAKGAARIKRPVQPDEKFRVVGVNGDDVTISDLFGNEATLNRNSIRIMESPPTPAPVATASPATNAASTPSANPGASPSTVSSSSSWPSTYQVMLSLELPPPPPGTPRVRRPYVAMWVEDASGKPIRTITVWGTSAKWLPDLSNWWKFAKGQNNLISSTTRATRDAGKYQVAWDGLDDNGKPVGQGTYALVLEVNRQHGAHEIHRSTIECGGLSTQATIPGALEFLDCPIAYGPPSS